MSEIDKAARDMMRDYVETFPDMREHLVSREYALALLNAADQRDALAAENARLREAVTRARVRIQEHLDMGLETRCPDDCDPEHDFSETLADLDDALAARALVEAPR